MFNNVLRDTFMFLFFVLFLDAVFVRFIGETTVKSLRARLTEIHFAFGCLFFPSSQWKAFLAIDLSILIQTLVQLAVKL